MNKPLDTLYVTAGLHDALAQTCIQTGASLETVIAAAIFAFQQLPIHNRMLLLEHYAQRGYVTERERPCGLGARLYQWFRKKAGRAL
jgi:hypothetical protein